MLDKRHIDQFVVTAEIIADFGVVHNAFSAITHLNYFCLFGPYLKLRCQAGGLRATTTGVRKLVHYNYTALFIYSTSYKLAVPFLVSFRLLSSFACIPHMSPLSRHSLALTQASDSGPDPVSEYCNIG